MSNFKKINGNFVVASRQIAQDKRLSWKARGIFLYLASMNDGWNFYVDEIAKHSPQGKEALQGGLKELEKYGYLKRIRTRKEKGHLSTFNWELYFNPVCLQQENPSEGKTLQQENRPLISNNNNKEQLTISNNNNNTTNASVDEISSIESPSNQDKVLGCGSVYEFYEKNIGMTSPYIREDIQYEFDDWMQINKAEASQIIIEALKIAVEAQASNKWRYAKSILKSWEEKNIKSLKDIEADDAQHRRKMDSRFNARKPREEKMPDWVNEQPQDDQQEASPEDMAEIQRLFKKINQNDEED